MCFPRKRQPMKRTHPENLFEEMLVQNVFSCAAAANERKPPSKSLQRNTRRVEFKEEKRRSFLLTFHSTSLLFSASLCCSVREGRCCTLQRSSTILLLLHNLKIPPSFKDLGVHTVSVPTYSHFQAVCYVLLTLRSASPPWTSALHPVTWRRSGVFSVDGKCFMGFSFQWVFPQYGVLTIVLFSGASLSSRTWVICLFSSMSSVRLGSQGCWQYSIFSSSQMIYYCML